MPYERGFKTRATAIANEVRAELGLRPYDRLNPKELAEVLAIPVIDLSSYLPEAPAVEHLRSVEPEVFSAVTVFCGSRRSIVHNDGHSEGRQNSNISHELSHGLLLHPPTPALDDRGCRNWNQDVEDEAAWLAGCLLMTEQAALTVAKGQWTRAEAAVRLGISEDMVRFRLNVTGAMKRTRRSAAASGRR